MQPDPFVSNSVFSTFPLLVPLLLIMEKHVLKTYSWAVIYLFVYVFGYFNRSI